MDELFEDDGSGGNAPEYTVSEISGAVKRTIEGGFSHVRVRGEVGRVSRPRSGHVYLDLKDDRACLAGVVWKGTAARLTTQPEEGMEVVVTGRLTTFPGQSKYQIVVETIAPAGVGALMAMLDRRRRALEAEGLFAAERKRPIPFLPEVIGVVTSPSGAVIRDILHRLRDRFPRRVLVWPVAVQGAACAPEVARAIAGFNALPAGGPIPRPDLLIVARGGGSIEDLWGFNEEEVVRAAAASEIPLISAVGHETDTTLIDHAADRRAPTPTAAAEMAVPVRRELIAWAEGQGARLARALNQGLTRREQRLRDLSRALPRPEGLVAGPRQRLDWASIRLPAGLRGFVDRRRGTLTEAGSVLRPATLRARVSHERQRLRGAERRHAPGLRRLVEARRSDLREVLRGLSARAFARDVRERRLRVGQAARVLRRDAALRFLVGRREALDRSGARLTRSLIARLIAAQRDRLDARSGELAAVAARQTQGWRQRLQTLDRVRQTAGYEATLARGYAVVWQGEALVTSAAAARQAGDVDLQFADGRVSAAIGGPARAPRPKRAKAAETPRQKSLF